MKFFEENTIWDKFPHWVRISIDLGYKWRMSTQDKRRITFISMPCDTPTAGLIALGAIRADLSNSEANNTDGHFKSIIQACTESLNKRTSDITDNQNERPWDIRNTQDDTTWLFAECNSHAGIVYVKDSGYRPFVKRKGKKVANPSGQCTSSIFPHNALRWQLKDHPLPVAESNSQFPLDKELYNDLGRFDSEILDTNLYTSYDGIILVTKSASEHSNYMKKLALTGFIRNDNSYVLPELLTISSDQKHHLMRLRVISETKLEPETHAHSKLIIADGVNAFINAESKYPASDIIAILNRSGSPDSLEQLKDWVTSKERYYSKSRQNDLSEESIPKEILVRVLERKS